MSDLSPTKEFYNLFVHIFEHYNKTLFDSILNNPMIIVTRKSSVAGYYCPRRWTNFNKTELVDEIAINPEIFSKNPINEICQTIVHEMCHQWQHNFGKPSRSGYHNKEWADKMEEIGLMPSTTGNVGGNKTGQNMSDYIIIGGLFDTSTKNLITKDIFKKLYFDTNNSSKDFIEEEQTVELNYQNTSSVKLTHEYDENNSYGANLIQLAEKKTDKNKIKYTCNTCDINLWGKPGLKIICGECKSKFEEVTFKNLN